jgi:3-isopropylmalate/(R)-2-methylmalate dehydratase small subunit
MKGNIIKYPRDNIDTDVIIPGQYLKVHDYAELATHAMEGLDPDFHSKVKEGDFILSGKNFGCGSSREHAVWALDDYGFSVIISSSFADIFFSNCFKNGILPISLESKIVAKLLQETSPIEVDLENQIIKTPSEDISFEINSHKKKILLEGLDDIAQTFQFEDKISEFEEKSTVPSVL